MSKFVIVLAFALTLGLGGGNVARSQVVADFKRLCIDTHAEPSAAFAAADASGWTAAPEQTQNFSKLSGNPDGRAIHQGTADFRALTVSTSIVGVAEFRKCYVISRMSFAEATAGISSIIPEKTVKKTDSRWDWSLIWFGGSRYSVDALREKAYFSALQRSPLIQVAVLGFDGGSILSYSELGKPIAP